MELRLRAAVESSPSGLLMVDSDGRIVLVNREVERLFGYPREELLGQSLEILIPERFRDAHPGFRTSFMQEPSVRPMGAGRDLYGLHKNGTEVPVEIGLTPVATEEGVFVLGSIVDITERKRADELFRAAVESSPAGMIMVDREGHILLVNREIERLFGYSREEILGESIETLVPERFRRGHPGFRAGFFQEPKQRSMGAGRELFGLRKDGTEVPVEIGLNPIETEGGMLVLSSVVDISARKENEAQRRNLEEQLRHSQKIEAVGTLAGGVAHDFNNILAAVTMYTELIREEVRSDQLRADADAVLEAAIRGKELVQRILLFSRRQEGSLKSVSLASVVREVEALLRATLPSRIAIRVSATGPDALSGDPASLQQVVMNLANNAAQAMPRGGALEVNVAPYYLSDSRARAHPTLREGPYVALTVADDGEGIAPEDQARVFDPFFTTKPVGSGTGLGLALVHNIVQDHGGAVDLESEVGVGTTVRCLFPLLEDEFVDAAGIAPAEPHPTGNGELVMVVDDEPALVAGMERRLRSLGYEVRAHTDPGVALEDFERDPAAFDIVITDYTMPGLDGIELGRRVVQIRPDVPILLATGYLDSMDAGILESAGVVGVLTKPATVAEVAHAIRDGLRPE